MRGVEIVEQPAKSILNRVAGMPFAWSINPYRGCYHRCVFCYARRTHAYLDEDGLDRWGSRIFVKTNAPAVLRTESPNGPGGTKRLPSAQSPILTSRSKAATNSRAAFCKRSAITTRPPH